MTLIDRDIALARTRDGHNIELFTWHIAMAGPQAWSLASEIDVNVFRARALESWHCWATGLPDCRKQRLVAEAGLVVEAGVATPFAVVHSAGAVLAIDPSPWETPGALQSICWDEVADSALVLGSAATLALVNFMLDGVLDESSDGTWPFEDNLIIADTTMSPYAPQCRSNGGLTHRRLALTASGSIGNDTVFLLLQRSERWQRPLNALYNIRRRNLNVSHRRSANHPVGAVVIDSLTPENEPTHQQATWLATWFVQSPNGRRWGAEPLVVRFAAGELLGAALGATGRPGPACVSDPIEGDAFGFAPPLLLEITSSELLGMVMRS